MTTNNNLQKICQDFDQCSLAGNQFDGLNSIDNRRNVTTDAVLSNLHKITTDDVHIIEKELDNYEKISLIFLLFDNAEKGLHPVYDGYQNSLAQWLKEEKSNPNWQYKIIEALCIIQNFAVIRKLGYDKTELLNRYLPNNYNTSLYVDIVRKVLYMTCETMSTASTKQFLQLLREDFKLKCIHFPSFPEKYLELYFLHCFSINYIHSKDISNIIKIFKRMGLDTTSYILSSVSSIKNCSTSENNSVVNCQNVNDGQSIMLNNSVRFNIPSNDLRYHMEHDNAGICMIINQEKFHINKTDEENLAVPLSLNGKPLNRRYGTNIDKRKLKETFEYFGFRTYLFDDLDHEDMLIKIRRTMGDFKKIDCCFVVCILSHGQPDQVFGSDCVPVDISEIEDAMHDTSYVNLLQKPKILIIQSCQGDQLQQVVDISIAQTINNSRRTAEHIAQYNRIDGPTSLEKSTPERCDLVVCTSTENGFASIRNEREGGWYIQELCARLLELAEQHHFLDILTHVTNRVMQKSWSTKGQVLCMVPPYKSTFSKFLYLHNPINK